jgi:hypothetical protein
MSTQKDYARVTADLEKLQNMADALKEVRQRNGGGLEICLDDGSGPGMLGRLVKDPSRVADRLATCEMRVWVPDPYAEPGGPQRDLQLVLTAVDDVAHDCCRRLRGGTRIRFWGRFTPDGVQVSRFEVLDADGDVAEPRPATTP